MKKENNELQTEESELFQLIEKELENKLKQDLTSKYTDNKFNEMKFKLAKKAILHKNSFILEIILKSLVPEIANANNHLRELIQLAKGQQAESCLKLLESYYPLAKIELIAYMFKCAYYGEQEMKNADPFEHAVFEEFEKSISYNP